MRHAARLWAILALSILLASCGTATTSPTSPETGATGRWQREGLDLSPGADQGPVLVAAGDDVLVMTASDDGSVTSALSRAGGDFETGTPLDTGLGFVQIGGAVALPGGGWLALGSGGTQERDGDRELRFDAFALRSADGLTWKLAEVSGFDHPVDLLDLTVAGDTVVVAGAYRLAADPAMGGVEAHLWTSADGADFRQVDLPGVEPPRDYRHESYAGHLAEVGGRLLAAGRVGPSATVWTSDDAGVTWTRVEDPILSDTYDLTGLAVVDGVVLAGAAEGSVTALRSTDRGASWSPVDGLPVAEEEAGWAPVWAAGGRFWTLTGVDDTSWSRPEVCYADLDSCGLGEAPEAGVATSLDGSTWTDVELPGELDSLVGTDDGRTLALTGEGGLSLLTLAAGAAPPRAPERSRPPTVQLVTPAAGEDPEVGVRYHAPLYLHCGMDWLWFGDATWRRTDRGADLETGAGDRPPSGWPVANEALYGFATLTDADHLDYSIGDGEVIATYERDPHAPGCA